MSTSFRAVQWNRAKLVYDGVLVAGVVLFIGIFILRGWWINPPDNQPGWIDLCINACGSCAFLMLTLILSIGPLARLDRRFLPLLYNRRHFGVLTFGVALLHAAFVVAWFQVQGKLPDLLAELTDNPLYGSFIGFPMKALGLAALCVLFLLAATSHDYWLTFLTPPKWKRLHMALYLAYGLVAMHVALGVMQDDPSPLVPVLFGGAFVWVTLLHLLAGWRERTVDRGSAAGADGWIAVGPPTSIPDKGARIIAAEGGERIAVFRDGEQIGALTNLCAHQNGPLGEGRIIDGCVTCPWHGYQYRLEDGCAPAPFTERLATYRVRVADGVVQVHPRALPPGTPAAIRIAIRSPVETKALDGGSDPAA
jgi:nitrite reductase/ring-hydroxylating ferredoxin subunit/DMSO/TMAO reductase YedYZ heme-binding membrane subunit